MTRRKPITWRKLAPLASKGRVADLLDTYGEPYSPGTPEEQALDLLAVAAEVEHALMVQYLYAAYSCTDASAEIRETLQQIAKQEMGHLMTVQNLRLMLGEEPYLGRQDLSPQPEKDPYPFRREPVSRTSLARYVRGEAPSAAAVPAEHRAAFAEVEQVPQPFDTAVQRVGLIYAKLYWLFMASDDATDGWADIPVDAFKQQSAGRHVAEPTSPQLARQSTLGEWGGSIIGFQVLQCATRAEARKAIHDIAVQGEGGTGANDSHFVQLLGAFKKADHHDAVARPLPVDPTLELGHDGTIDHPIAAPLAAVCDAIYSTLIVELLLALDRERPDPLRKKLLIESRADMIGLGSNARRLTRLPQRLGGAADGPVAGPPFTLSTVVQGDRPALHAAFHTAIDVLADAVARLDPATDGIPALAAALARKRQLHHEFVRSTAMTTIYRIHPGVGIARVGNSPEFFVGPESSDQLGTNLDAEGSDAGSATSRKDADHRLRRQAARFSVWAYERDDTTGRETLIGEVSPAQATVTWEVQLANTKAAGAQILRTVPGVPRNPNVPAADLSITPVFPPITGVRQQAVASIDGRYRGQVVELGELRTDALGRLLVLGGHGRSGSPSGNPITSFANNADWFDDMSDGPIDATLLFPDGTTIRVDHGAWLIVAPPDYAPAVEGLVSLRDIALDAAVKRGWRTLPARPSYRDDILPLLQRCANLRFVNQFAHWNEFTRLDHALLGELGNPAADAARALAYTRLLDVEDSGILSNLRFTALQRAALAAWRAGEFMADYTVARPPAQRHPAAIDEAALANAVGGGFYPGIEMGALVTNSSLYSEPFRFTRASFHDHDPSVHTDGPLSLRAGSITERMACPWQADFLKCAGNWWPAQRPDAVMTAATDAQPADDWAGGIVDHADLVADFWKLGVVLPTTDPLGRTVQVERERHPDKPR